MIAQVATTSTSQRSAMARRERARRQLARTNLTDFCCYVDQGAASPGALDSFISNHYRAQHLALIANYIEGAANGSLFDAVPGNGKKILIITTPPGHWKSSLVSRKLPAFFVARRAEAQRLARKVAKETGQPLAAVGGHQVILTSYNATLAQSNNRAVLELVRDNAQFKKLFPHFELSKNNQSSEEWALAGDTFPACVAAGVGGGLTGKHADLCIVDDPIKDRAQANSQTYINQLWDWWNDVLRTRVNPMGFILGIWTRWSENDPAGRLAKQLASGESEERLVMLRLPALAETQKERAAVATMGLPVDERDPLNREPGQALWPAKESAAEHLATKRTAPLTFDSLMQGRPRPSGGHLAGREAITVLAVAPATGVRWIYGTDWALTEKQASPKAGDPDYTVIARVGLWQPDRTGQARLIISHIERGQLGPAAARKMVKDQLVAAGRAAKMVSGQANFERIHLADLRADPQLMGVSMRNMTRKQLMGDKVTRATPWLEMAEAGLVYAVAGAWNNDFFNELENFPHGAHDDQIDAISVAVIALGIGARDKKARSANVAGFGRY